MKGRNILFALLLSLVLSFIGLGIYIFYPLIIVMLTNRQGAGIGSTGGYLLDRLLVMVPILFIIIFALLQWKSKKS